MRHNKTPLTMVAALSAAALTAHAQDTTGWGRFGLSYRAAFNISASFSGLGGYNPGANPGGPGRVTAPDGTIARQYDDGFIGIDSSGNAGESTWYWGYNSASQIVGDNLLLHTSSSSASTSSGRVRDEPQHGMELSYDLPLGGGKKWHWGLDSALNWTDIGITDRRTLSGTVVTQTHAYALNGITAPVSPYAGTFEGPGALISDVATDVSGSPTPNAASISGTRRVEGNLYGLRLGPYIEYAPVTWCSFLLSGGLSAGYLRSEFNFEETVSISGLPSQSRSGRNRDSDWLVGGFIHGQVNFRLCQRASLFTGVEFQDLGTFEQSVAGKTARLDLRAGIFVTGGLSVSF